MCASLLRTTGAQIAAQVLRNCVTHSSAGQLHPLGPMGSNMITQAVSTGPIKTGSTGWLTSMAFSPDNTELYVCSYTVTHIFLFQKT